MTVGGGSAVNGQFLDRGSRYDYDEWARLGSPQFDDSPHQWDWENFGPALKKVSFLLISAPPPSTRPLLTTYYQSLFLTEPSHELVKEYGYTWDSSQFEGDAIEASFPPFQWPIRST